MRSTLQLRHHSCTSSIVQLSFNVKISLSLDFESPRSFVTASALLAVVVFLLGKVTTRVTDLHVIPIRRVFHAGVCWLGHDSDTVDWGSQEGHRRIFLDF